MLPVARLSLIGLAICAFDRFFSSSDTGSVFFLYIFACLRKNDDDVEARFSYSSQHEKKMRFISSTTRTRNDDSLEKKARRNSMHFLDDSIDHNHPLCSSSKDNTKDPM